MRLFRWGQILLGGMYLLGGCLHLLFGLTNPQVYPALAESALIPLYRELFANLGNPALFAFAIALFEFILAVLIFDKGTFAKIGLLLSIGFQIMVAPLGFWGIANVLLAVLQAPLLIGIFDSVVLENLQWVARQR